MGGALRVERRAIRDVRGVEQHRERLGIRVGIVRALVAERRVEVARIVDHRGQEVVRRRDRVREARADRQVGLVAQRHLDPDDVLDGRINPGRVFDYSTDLDGVDAERASVEAK